VEQADHPEPDQVNDDREFWLAAGRSSLDAVWKNVDDDVYADLSSGCDIED
jgi:hypothetical protein